MTEMPYTYDCSKNCGSYALNLKDWFRFQTRVYYGVRQEQYNEYLQVLGQEILRRFPRLQQVDRTYVDKYPHKVIIAFRLSMYDWHFIVRRNHSWKGKMGHSCVYQYTKEEVLEQIWKNGCGDKYDSEILFFAYR